MSVTRITKGDAARRGDSRITSVFVVFSIIATIIYWPLIIPLAFIFILYKYSTAKDIKAFDESGEVYLGGEKTEVISLKHLFPTAAPFYFVIDVETTGLLVDDTRPTIKKVKDNPDWYPRIVQVAWLTLSANYQPIQYQEYFIKQEKEIPNKATEIHGYTKELCEKNGVELTEALERLRESAEGCDYYVGHNVQFDRYVVEAECIKTGLPKPFKYMRMYDTMKMGKGVSGRRRQKLKELAQYVFGTKELTRCNIRFHNAISDVQVTASLFKELHSRGIKY